MATDPRLQFKLDIFKFRWTCLVKLFGESSVVPGLRSQTQIKYLIWVSCRMTKAHQGKAFVWGNLILSVIAKTNSFGQIKIDLEILK